LDFQEFKNQLINFGKSLINEYSRKYNVPLIEIYIADTKVIFEQHFFVTGVYLTEGMRISIRTEVQPYTYIIGPAILISEDYLKILYDGVIRTGRMDLALDIFKKTISHEFAHHVYHITRRGTPFHWDSLRKNIVREEISSSLISYSLTNKTRSEQNKEFKELTGISIYEFRDIQLKRLREYWEKRYEKIYFEGLKLKQPIRLYCPKCGYERIITDPIEAITITDTSYKLAREGKESTCPRCGYPIASEPCILYPGGWRVLSKLIEEY
jgi:ribosomal protein S27AE